MRVCAGVAIPWDDLPTCLLARPEVRRRRYRRGNARPEARFLFSDPDRLLPVLWQGQLRLLPWGARRGDKSGLPCTSMVWKATLERGVLREAAPELAAVPASFALDCGVWFHVVQGIQALVVSGRQEQPVAYLLVEPASHYYRVMTRSKWMPCLVGQTI
jgi:hypothetical protein